jgi:hypothetical protein
MRISSRVNQLTKSNIEYKYNWLQKYQISRNNNKIAKIIGYVLSNNRIIYDAKGCSDVVLSLSQTVPLTNPKFSIYWGGNHDNLYQRPHLDTTWHEVNSQQ